MLRQLSLDFGAYHHTRVESSQETVRLQNAVAVPTLQLRSAFYALTSFLDLQPHLAILVADIPELTIP